MGEIDDRSAFTIMCDANPNRTLNRMGQLDYHRIITVNEIIRQRAWGVTIASSLGNRGD